MDDYVRELAKKGVIEFDGFTEGWGTGQRIKVKIQSILLKELLLRSKMTDEEIHPSVDELIDEHLDAVLET